MTGRDEQLAGWEILPRGAHVQPAWHRAGDLGAAVGTKLDPFPRHHRVQADRYQIAGIDPGERPGRQLPRARRNRPSQPLIAIPSIAAQSARGTGQRARTGATVTRPSPSCTGTSCGAGAPRQPAAAHASIHCE